MKLVKYFLQKRAVTILLLVLVLAGGIFQASNRMIRIENDRGRKNRPRNWPPACLIRSAKERHA